MDIRKVERDFKVAMKEIKKFCEDQPNCERCHFIIDGKCVFGEIFSMSTAEEDARIYVSPECWEPDWLDD